MFNNISITLPDGCGESKGCLRIPSGCTQPDCDFLATYQSKGKEVTFELFGRDVDWVSIGFNNAKSMVCISFYYILSFTWVVFSPFIMMNILNFPCQERHLRSAGCPGLKTITEKNDKAIDSKTPV